MAEMFDSVKEGVVKLAGFALEKAGDVAAFAKDKASDTADSVKLEMAIRKGKKELHQEYEMLGQIVYNIRKGALNENEEILDAAVKRIDTDIEKLEALKAAKEAAAAGVDQTKTDLKDTVLKTAGIVKDGAKKAAKTVSDYAVDTYGRIKEKAVDLKEKTAVNDTLAELRAKAADFREKAEDKADDLKAAANVIKEKIVDTADVFADMVDAADENKDDE